MLYFFDKASFSYQNSDARLSNTMQSISAHAQRFIVPAHAAAGTRGILKSEIGAPKIRVGSIIFFS